MDYKATVSQYYVLAKPGIIYANIITALAGYFLASRFAITWTELLGLVAGLSLVIAGACAYNNYLDRGIDAVMKRTKSRGLVTGSLTAKQALTFATIVTAAGLLILLLTQNMLTVLLTAIAFVDYVFLYGYSKRKSKHGTLVGCVSGAIPLVAGYTAVTGRLDATAGLLFALMVAWQMAHFYGIALYRLKDYQAVHIPVMPAVVGVRSTKRQTIGYIGLFIIIAIYMGASGSIGLVSAAVIALLGAAWLLKAVTNYNRLSSDRWGRQAFLFSLPVMLGMSLMISVGSVLA